MQNKKLLIFDFDGVIENTFELSYGLLKEQFSELTHEEYRTWFDGNLFESLEAKGVKIDFDIFFERYGAALVETNIQENIKDALTKLSEQYSFAIVSSSHDEFLNTYLERNGIRDMFDQVWGMKKHLGKVEKIQSLEQEHGVSASDAWFITDTVGDIKEGAGADVPTIATTWGYHSREHLEEANPTAIVDSPEELVAYLKS